ncbi:metalloendopeptidase [Sporobolomyces koalae]|uniref:metalloendopeptidase n=1 Tax=Sporobolomyces koalae TaxID=500713 RepID=UPI00316D8236
MSSSTSREYHPAPVPPPAWTSLSKTSIPLALERSIAQSEHVLTSIVSLPVEQRTFETVVRPLALRMGQVDREVEPSLFMQYVASNDKPLRDASVLADKHLNEWSLKSLMRVDVYEALLDADRHTREHSIDLNSEERRLLDRLLLDRQRNGLALDPDQRAAYFELKKQIMTLEVDFQKNCNEEDGSILFTRQELDGVPEDVIQGYERVPQSDGTDTYKMTFKTPDYIPVIKQATNAKTRKRANQGYEAKTSQNAPLLSEIVRLRQQAAELLGYKNHSEWVLQVNMNKTPDLVLDFLHDLQTKLRPLGIAEKDKFLQLKRQEFVDRGWQWDEAKDARLYLWDYRYYERMSLEKELDLDDNLLQEYFPVSHVVPAVIELYKDLLGIELIKVPKQFGETYHEDVEMFAVWENGQVGAEGAFKGYITLDLFPRNNKYGHAAVWGLIPGWTDEQGKRQYPVVAMVANLAKPTPTRPALMKHQDVLFQKHRFLHELGHGFHGLLAETQFAKFHGTAVARDFVEAPSQMLENWCWEPSVLKALSSHFERKNESIPEPVMNKLIKSRSLNQGLFNLRQLFFGLYDMRLHTTDSNLDPNEQTRLWNELREQVSLVQVEQGEELVPGQSGFAHIAGGYSSGYYGYLSSQVYSADMFATKFKRDPMNSNAGRAYRNEILKPGASRSEMDSLVAFLGREPNNKAFLDSLLGQERH